MIWFLQVMIKKLWLWWNAAIDNGIHIPEDMEVIGMMNTSYALICRPSLTSIHVPVYDMGALAVRLLTKILNEEEIEIRQWLFNIY